MNTARIKIKAVRTGAKLRGQDLAIIAVDPDGSERLLPVLHAHLECHGRDRDVELTVSLAPSDIDIDGEFDANIGPIG